MDAKPYSASCDRNREPILEVLRKYFADRRAVLEIGSGTGQHAVHFAQALPHLVWQTSDLAETHAGIRAWIDAARLPNLRAPLLLDVSAADWPAQRFDAVFSANTLHIMSWPEVQLLFAHVPGVMTPDALLVTYGPFNYGGHYTSPGNAAFDSRLKWDAPYRGIRDFEAVDRLAAAAGLALIEDRAMPANNRCLIWRRRG